MNASAKTLFGLFDSRRAVRIESPSWLAFIVGVVVGRYLLDRVCASYRTFVSFCVYYFISLFVVWFVGRALSRRIRRLIFLVSHHSAFFIWRLFRSIPYVYSVRPTKILVVSTNIFSLYIK